MQQLQKDQRQQQLLQQQLIDSNRIKNKNRILIVDNDDKPDNNTTLSLRLELERNGFKVDIFTDPLLALDHFNSAIYNMIILDKKMSKMNAIELHKKFKEIDDKVRICILGSYDTYGV